MSSEKVLKYLQQHSGSEDTISAAIGVAPAEVYRTLTVLMENGQVEIFQSQSGDEMYRSAARRHTETPKKRINEAPSWGAPMHLESAWPRLVTDAAPTLVVADEGASFAAETAAIEAQIDAPRVKKLREPKKRKNVPFTPLSWDQKESSAKQYNKDYYESL